MLSFTTTAEIDRGGRPSSCGSPRCWAASEATWTAPSSTRARAKSRAGRPRRRHPGRAPRDRAHRRAARARAGARGRARRAAIGRLRRRWREQLGALPDQADDARADDWGRALALDPDELTARVGLAALARTAGDHAAAIGHLRVALGAGLAGDARAHAELALARSLAATGAEAHVVDEALARAAAGTGPDAALAQAERAERALRAEPDAAAGRLDRAIGQLIEAAEAAFADDGAPLRERAAALAMQRGALLDARGDRDAAVDDYRRAHTLAAAAAPAVARDAARTLLARDAASAASERRWIDAVLATRPEPDERAELLLRRARLRLAEPGDHLDLGATIADVHEAASLATSPGQQRAAYEFEAELLARAGDRRGRAQVLSARAALPATAAERAAAEGAAAEAWLDAGDAATALPHGSRAVSALDATVAPAVRRQLLATLGEAAWRQRSFGEVVLAYVALLADEHAPTDVARARMTFRLASAMERTGDRRGALATLRPLAGEPLEGELRGQVLRLLAELTEAEGDPVAAAAALEALAADPPDGADETAPVPARADAWYRAGELHRRRGDGAAAVRCLEAALKLVEHHLPALDALEQLHRETGDLERVAVILGRKIAATTRQPSRQKALLARLGAL
ncbi:MAG: hypothetical protein R2939_23075, partial [Kofleriaceae bacterium]